MRFRALRLVLLLALSTTLSATASWAENVIGVTDTEIRIGQWGPQTGPAAPWGAVARGTDMYFKMINEQDGGIHGRKLKHMMFDDGYNPARTKAGVKELVEGPGVFAFVSGVGTAPGLAVMDYLIEKNIPWINPSTGSTYWAYPPKKTVFAVYPNYPDEGNILASYAVDDLGKKRVAMLYQNDDYGLGGVVGVKNALQKRNLSLVAEVPVEPTEKDLKSHIARLKSANPDVVILFAGPTQVVIGRKVAAAMKFDPLWMSTSTLSDVAFMNQITSGLWEGTIFTSFGALPTDDTPLMNRYRDYFQKNAPEGERFSTFFLAGYGYAEPLVEGLKLAGRDLTTENFIQAMESIKNFQGILGRVTYGPDKRQGQRACFLAKAGKGEEIIKLSDWIYPDN
jgi:branched-chain amino acid transport system substrate-binding protein